MDRLIKIIAFAITILVATPTIAANTITYTYDDLNRLAMVTRSDGPTLTYNYDEVGNITGHTSNNPDSDGDGLTDIAEINVHGSSPSLGDTDLDGLSDGDEANIGTDPTNPDTDGDGVSDGNEIAAGTDPLIPASQGTEEMPTITTTMTPALQGDNLGIAWSGIAAPTSFDWVGVYQPGTGNNAYLDWTYIDGTERGERSLTLDDSSLVPGIEYEVRLYKNDTYTRLATSAPFILSPTEPTVIAASTPVTQGGKLSISWAGIANPTATDWIGIYEPGTRNRGPDRGWKYTEGGAEGNMSLLLNAPSLVVGKIYEVRLYARDGYTRLATSGSFILQAGSIDDQYHYTVANPGLSGAEAWVVSLSDNNMITAGNTILILNQYERGQIPAGVLTQGMVVSGEGPFDMGGSVNATDTPLSHRLAGIRFVVPQTRYTHLYYLVSPEGDATVQMDVNGVVTSLSLTQGQVVEFNAGYDTTGTALINSDRPILVAHRGENGSVFADASPVPPAALELWGVRTTAAYVGALEDNTTLRIYADDGSSVVNVVLNAGQRYKINSAGVSGTQGSGSGLRIISDKPIGAIQVGDGDGSDRTAFMPTSQLGSRFGLPTAAQYVAVVCPTPNTVVILYDGINPLQLRPCGSDGVNPGKAYFGSVVNGINIGAGAYLESSEPVYAIYEDAATDDERNLNPEVMEIPTVATTTTPASQGGNLGVAWSGIANPTLLDWVGVYQVGTRNAADLGWAYTDGTERGERPLTLDDSSLVPGIEYEVRLYENDTYTRLATSTPFVLNPIGPKVIAASTPVTRGGKLSIAWTGIANPTATDWVGIYEPGTPNRAGLDWEYTNGGAEGNLSLLMDDPALVVGNIYEVRLYAQDGFTLLDTSGSFVLQDGSVQ